MANPSGPGILYVNSKIISSELSPELFTRWYQDIHIPDIFITSGIKSAFRYFTRASPEIVERPYLALYPLKDVGFLYTDEFKAIPVHSDILPNESRAIFDLADFDTRYYTSIGEVDSSNVREESNPYLATGQFDLPGELKGKSDTDVFEWYTSQVSDSGSSRIRLFRLRFARQNRLPPEQNQLQQPPELLVLHEFESEDAVNNFRKNPSTGSAASFKLLKAFRAEESKL